MTTNVYLDPRVPIVQKRSTGIKVGLTRRLLTLKNNRWGLQISVRSQKDQYAKHELLWSTRIKVKLARRLLTYNNICLDQAGPIT